MQPLGLEWQTSVENTNKIRDIIGWLPPTKLPGITTSFGRILASAPPSTAVAIKLFRFHGEINDSWLISEAYAKFLMYVG